MPKQLQNVAAIALAAAALNSQAAVPVIDAAAVANLIRQVAYWERQIAGMTNQLNQLRDTYSNMTGTRGMQSLLPATPLQRNYLPPDYAELMKTVDGASTTYAGLSAQVRSAMEANAVLSNAQMAGLSPDSRRIVENGRRSSAMLSSLTQAAYQNTSQRFAALSSLIEMVGAAGDLKAIQDLQGRVSAEQAMLTNEQTKLQALYQVAQAGQIEQQQRVREQVIVGHGGFSSRFNPVP